MPQRKSLPTSQLYDSRFKTVHVNYNVSLDELYNTVKEVRKEEKKRRKNDETQKRKKSKNCDRFCGQIWSKTFGLFNEDWVFLALLGILIAIVSYILDKGVATGLAARNWLYLELATNGFSKWVAFICLPVCFILFDVGFVHLVCPQSIGSGIPQIKTMLRGVCLKEFLTFRCFIAKWVGITSTLASGMPLGKEGPLIHMSSILVTKMGNFIRSLNKSEENINKTIELLGAAWAVGVACTFNSPIGGVLFSIEISTSYYAVRNYWRGFFAAVWAATTYRLLSVWVDGAGTITPVFKTSLYVDFPYDPQELFAFAILGVICGILGSLYVWFRQKYGAWLKTNKFIKKLKGFSIFAYPFIVVIVISTIQFPWGVGQFLAGPLPPRTQVVDLFSNFTWTKHNLNVLEQDVVTRWSTKWTGIYANLIIYYAFQFIASIVASSMAIPNGAFIPNFRSGAAIGRIAGELMHTWFPFGVNYKGKQSQIMPGAYAMVGAAALSGAVTHTLSTSVILFEMTSQITHVIPVLISVLISNGIARLLTPSVYDIVIISNNLPYLPDLLPSKSAIYKTYVEDFMISDTKYLYLGMSYRELKHLLKDCRKIKHFPIVDNSHNMILLGSISRNQLIALLENQIGRKRRMEILPYGLDEDGGVIDNPNEYEKEIQLRKKKLERERIFEKYIVDIKKEDIVEEKPKKVIMPIRRVVDMSKQQQLEWETNQLNETVDFSRSIVDPAPFQLVERTSLLKVHTLFSMLAINVAYVTSIGKLVGVVGLKELRQAIENANNNKLPSRDFVLKPLLPK
ncbi:unnamed protein product [Brassicogethes aeneus]|uniref:Chloride channel protein n=1 Tax=Brassicogethes aeneus TaxID=1431903 RepID=A0A9P0ATL9_BRAAE|nr:unnamed protein product [Brassicogethes aeneus]